MRKGLGVVMVSIGLMALLGCEKTADRPVRASDGGSRSLATTSRPTATEAPTPAQPIQTSSAGLPRLVDLGAGKCIPCKKMAPILEELKREYAGVMDVEFIDVWENPGVGRKYGIRAIPTQIFYDASGRELFRHEGFFGKEEILEKWRELGVELRTKPSEASPTS